MTQPARAQRRDGPVTAHALSPLPVDEDQDEVTAALLAAITPEFAATIRWDPEVRVIGFPQDHPTLGWTMCQVPGCVKSRTNAEGICRSCYVRWLRQDRPDLEEFKARPKTFRRASGVYRCRVPAGRLLRGWRGPRRGRARGLRRGRDGPGRARPPRRRSWPAVPGVRVPDPVRVAPPRRSSDATRPGRLAVPRVRRSCTRGPSHPTSLVDGDPAASTAPRMVRMLCRLWLSGFQTT